MTTHEPPGSRLMPARRRARLAKGAIAAGGTIVFLVAALLAKIQYPGHAKHPTRPLAAPRNFVRAVRENQLQAGIIAPTQAPPDASSSQS